MTSRRDCKDWLRPECAGCVHLRRFVFDDETPAEACAIPVFAWDAVHPKPHHVIARHAPCPPAAALARVAEVEDWLDGDYRKRPCPVRTEAAE